MGIADTGDITVKITAADGPPKARSMLALTGSAYDAAGYGSQELAGWHPKLESADAEILPSRDKIVARSRALDRNNGWAYGGIDRRVDAVVGSNIRLRCKPDFMAMGLGEEGAEWADRWAKQVEAQFRVWANSSRFLNDVERHQHFGGQVELAYQHYVLDGEACAAVYMLDRGSPYETAILVVDPDRLSNPDNRPDGKDANGRNYRGGVELDAYGAARAYHVRKSHPADVGGDWSGAKWERIPRESRTGRPLFIHSFRKRRAHMRRGVGRLASVMRRFKGLDTFDQNTLQQEITRSVFGLYATTRRDANGIQQSLAGAPIEETTGFERDEARAAFYGEHGDLTLNGVRIAVLPDGDMLQTVETNHSSSDFAPFQSAFLRSIASALGISYEQLSQDWANINYSSARTLLNEIWRGLLSDRHTFTQSFCTPVFAAWLEEAVAKDLVDMSGVPGGKMAFYLFRDALTQCEWLGPGRGWVDPKKEAEAAEIRMRIGLASQDSECAEQGRDAEEVRWQRKRDQEENRRYGLAPSEASPAPPDDDDNDDPDRADIADRRERAGEPR